VQEPPHASYNVRVASLQLTKFLETSIVTYRLLPTRILTCVMGTLVPMLALGLMARADESTKPVQPKVEGRPVAIIAGKVVVFPEGVDEAPKDYRGAIGPRPLALIQLNGKIVGEVFVAPLDGPPGEEAKGMAASADNNKIIELVKQTTIKDGEDKVHIVTLKIDAESKVGKPFLVHSLYFPRGKSSTTFKLATSEENFDAVMPFFQTMLFYGKDKKKSEEK